MIRLPIFLLAYAILLMGTNASANLCGVIHPSTHANQYQQLLQLSNFKTIQHFKEIPARLHRITQIFAIAGDRRGLFPGIYAPVAERTIQYLATLPPSTQVPLRKIIWIFAERYFNTLNKHLTAQPIPAYWHLYYQSSLTCPAPSLLVISYGLLAHLSFDLKHALTKANVTDGLFPDYLRLGNDLTRTKPIIIHNIARLYHIDIRPLLEGFWVSDTLNRRTQAHNLSAILTFNALRMEAWMSSRAQHYSLGYFDHLVEQSQMMLWKMRVEMLNRMALAGMLSLPPKPRQELRQLNQYNRRD